MRTSGSLSRSMSNRYLDFTMFRFVYKNQQICKELYVHFDFVVVICIVGRRQELGRSVRVSAIFAACRPYRELPHHHPALLGTLLKMQQE